MQMAIFDWKSHEITSAPIGPMKSKDLSPKMYRFLSQVSGGAGIRGLPLAPGGSLEDPSRGVGP